MLVDRKKFKKCIILLLILAIYIPVMLSHRFDLYSNNFIRIACITSLCIYIYEIWSMYTITEKLFTPATLFLIAFYMFQNGQLLLLSLGIDFNDFYINSLKSYTIPVVVFSSISNVIAGFIAFFLARPKNKLIIHINNRKIDRISPDFITDVARFGFIITSIVAFPLILVKFTYSLSGGYNAVRAFEETLPSVVNFIEYFFMPFSVLYMVYGGKEKSKWVRIFVVIWALITSLCGDRTTGIGALVVVVYLFFLQTNNKKEGMGKKILKYIGLVVAALLIIILIQFAYAFRTKSGFDFSSMAEVFITTISDLGFSCFPLFTMMRVVPNSETFLLGQGYFLSVIGGLIPSFIDVTGTISKINAKSRIFETWQTKYYGQYSFGFGFSLNAEAYINFGWFGLISIAILLIIIFKLLDSYNSEDKNNLWGCYKTCILAFLWFTLPRRDSYYVWKAISYALIFMKVFIFAMRSIVKTQK